MPFIKLENITSACAWGIWEIRESLEELRSLLNSEEDFQKLKGIRNEEKLKDSIAARIVIQRILAERGISYKGMDCDENGKPFLKQHRLGISISHSHGAGVGIVYQNSQIGIDIEMIHEKVRNIAFRVFNKEEIGENGANTEKLVTLWCLKEVLYKAHGQKKLDFRENIHIKPFEYSEKGGISLGEIRTKEGVETFNIKYQRVKDYIIAYNLPK
ncbi:MAG: 4'-phosphopantetheinyl transferase superfamily protein [Cytophagaceae bacterium]|nr:4'-phosphopantetheinyl transferase superfamily protein [Cytophagaceae bacterium]